MKCPCEFHAAFPKMLRHCIFLCGIPSFTPPSQKCRAPVFPFRHLEFHAPFPKMPRPCLPLPAPKFHATFPKILRPCLPLPPPRVSCALPKNTPFLSFLSGTPSFLPPSRKCPAPVSPFRRPCVPFYDPICRGPRSDTMADGR